MAFPVFFYNFAKRSNSTKLPPETVGKTVNVSLKDETSILNPSLTLTIQSEADFGYNYAYIPKFNRYYFVNDKRFLSDHIVEVSLAVDVLATYKTDIQSTSAFVVYDTTSNAKNIVDKRLETVKNITHQYAAFTGDTIFTTEDRYVLTVVGKNGTGSYEIDSLKLNGIISGLRTYAYDIFNNLSDVHELLKQQNITEFSGGNAIQCIRSCIWHPFQKSTGSSWENVSLGDYDTGYTGLRVHSTPLVKHLTCQIPWNFSDWRNMSPYTELYCYLPYVGVINLSSSDLQGTNILGLTVSIESRTGNVAYQLSSNASGQVLGTYSADSHVDIPVGINAVNPANVAQAIANRATNNVNFGQGISGAISSAVGGNLGGFINSMSSVIGNDLKGQISNAAANVSLLTPTATQIGGMGGGAPSGLNQTPFIICISHDTVVSPSSVSAIMGTPECEVKSLSGLSGYVQTQGAEVSSTQATNIEINSINSLLDSGIYIE